MSNVIGFIPREEDEQPTGSTVFDFAIVPDPVFVENPVCPHCKTGANPELVETIEAVYANTADLLGDLMMCTDCSQLYLIVEFPVLPVSEPIMTQWTVPDKVYKNN